MMKTVSILGCGWLGEPLAEYLIKKGYSVKGSTTSVDKISTLTAKGIDTYLVQINNLGNEFLSFLNSEILIVNIPSKDIDGFKSMIAFLRKSPIKKVIFISSTSVYNDTNAIIFEHTLDSFSDSPLLEIEQLFKSVENWDTTIVRFGGLFGYSRKPGNFFGSGSVVSQPDAYVNMIHRDDCIEIIYQILEQEQWNETFNACADLHPTKRIFYSKATEIVGKTAPKFKEGEELSFKIISNDKIKKCLNYQFKHMDILKALEE